MHAGAGLHGDGFVALDPAVGPHHHLADRVLVGGLVADGVQVTGGGVEVAAGRERAIEQTLERVVRGGLQLVAQFNREAARLHQRTGLAGMADHVGVDGVATVPRPWRALLAQRLTDGGGAYPPIAVRWLREDVDRLLPPDWPAARPPRCTPGRWCTA